MPLLLRQLISLHDFFDLSLRRVSLMHTGDASAFLTSSENLSRLSMLMHQRLTSFSDSDVLSHRSIYTQLFCTSVNYRQVEVLESSRIDD